MMIGRTLKTAVAVGALALATTGCLSKNDHGVNVSVQHIRKSIRPHNARVTADVVYRNNTGQTKTASCKLIVGIRLQSGRALTRSVRLTETVGPYAKSRDHIREHIDWKGRYDHTLDPKLKC